MVGFLQMFPEAMNRMVREDPAALETVAIWGGRELLEQADCF